MQQSPSFPKRHGQVIAPQLGSRVPVTNWLEREIKRIACESQVAIALVVGDHNDDDWPVTGDGIIRLRPNSCQKDQSSHSKEVSHGRNARGNE